VLSGNEWYLQYKEIASKFVKHFSSTRWSKSAHFLYLALSLMWATTKSAIITIAEAHHRQGTTTSTSSFHFEHLTLVHPVPCWGGYLTRESLEFSEAGFSTD